MLWSDAVKSVVMNKLAMVGAAWLAFSCQANPLTDVSDAMLNPGFWIQASPQPDAVLLTQAQIQAQNAAMIRDVPQLLDLANLPEHYSQAEVRALIDGLSHPPGSERFYADGTALTPADYQRYQAAMALDTLAASVKPAYALVTSRGSIRTFPTLQRSFNQQMDLDLDRFQESGVFPGQWLQVLHYSRDRNWAFVRHYQYEGWLEVRHFALADKQQVLNFVQAKEFVLVTGAKAYTNYTPENPAVSKLALDMGVRLPRLSQVAELVNDQNSAFSYAVNLPVRKPDGSLSLQVALIGRGQDVQLGYLPLTRANIIRQAFKFLGERYGWGHDFTGRDCSGFIGEVYKTFGLILPRNTSTLGKLSFAREIQLAALDNRQKLEQLNQLDVGDLLVLPGHVVMVLGYQMTAQGKQLFVIHDVNGLNYYRADGSYQQSKLNGVSLTPFVSMYSNAEQSYLDTVYNIKILTGRRDADPQH